MRYQTPGVNKVRLRVHEAQGITEAELCKLCVPEDVMAQKSEEFFGDSSPCILHREAVAARLYDEVLEALAARRGKPLEADGRFKAWFGIGPEPAYFIVVE